MTERENQTKTFSLEGLVMSHRYEMLALITVLEKKGILSRAEIIEEIEAFRRK
jgi:hypothetical protein